MTRFRLLDQVCGTAIAFWQLSKWPREGGPFHPAAPPPRWLDECVAVARTSPPARMAPGDVLDQ